MLIKSRRDAEEFVARVMEFSFPSPYDDRWGFEIPGDNYIDPSLNRPTHIVVTVGDDGWRRYAYGRGWRDQGETAIADPVVWVYFHRAGINQYLRKFEETHGTPWLA